MSLCRLFLQDFDLKTILFYLVSAQPWLANRMMKTIVFSLSVLLLSLSAWAQPTANQISRARHVLSKLILPTQLNSLSPEKLGSVMKTTAYKDLRPRDYLRITDDVKEIYHRSGKALIDSQHEGFATDKDNIVLKKGDFIRVVQKFATNDVDFKNKDDFKGVQGSYIDVAEFTVVKLNANFEPEGDTFYLVARGGLDRTVAGVERFEGGFMSRNPSLSFSRAGLGDVIVNAQEIKSSHGQIPAFTPAIITKMVRTRINWTISNYDYVFTIYLLKCPKELYAKKCEVEINGTKAYPDPYWAHYTMPENRREVKFWGMSLMY